METTRSASPKADVAPAEMSEEGPSGPWPRSSALIVVLIVAFVFGALSFLPLVGAVLFYPAGALAASANFVTRSAAGDALQILYQLLLLELGYLLGKKVAFERDYLWLLVPAYFGAVIGYLIGIPGLQTTTVAGGLFLFQTNPIDPTHVQSAFLNSPTLMGMLISGIGLAFVMQRRSIVASTPAAENDLTSNGRLLLIFVTVTFFSFLGYMMPPIFYALFSAIAGPSAATTGILYSITTNSSVIANPLLFFVVLYMIGGEVKIFRDASTVLIMLFIAALVGAAAGNPIGSYFTSYIASGNGTFPNYLANINILTTFLTAVVAVSFSGTFLGFAAISESFTRRMNQTGTVPQLPIEGSETRVIRDS
ncbi:MAG: hypothetical protein OK455_09420 [Thaumarchaeota archaeon]|nr:hypothetical protein [Nitrososphaerota archaeon]